MQRRTFLGAAAAAVAASGMNASGQQRPRLGVVANVGREGADAALAQVARLGLKCCQLGVGMTPLDLADSIRRASARYGVAITALMTLGEGRMVWNLREGPETIGIVPRATREQRVQALINASELAKACGVDAIHTHCGFIPENPNDPLYREVVPVVGNVVEHCRRNGQTFLCETGQESPITLLRLMQDVNLDNIAVNLDLANLILYGKGEPVGALDVLGPRVRGIHAKDGRYPNDPYGLGQEVPIGSGEVHFEEVFRKLAKLGYAGPVTIEREISGEQQERDIRASMSYLSHLIDAQYERA
jgi:L-ribulose-5-phosphate 3-epimerase